MQIQASELLGLLIITDVLLTFKSEVSGQRGRAIMKEPGPGIFPPAQKVATKPYLVVFDREAGIDDILVDVEQTDKINRPNNAEDEDMVEDYVRYNYGSCRFEIFDLDNIPRVKI